MGWQDAPRAEAAEEGRALNDYLAPRDLSIWPLLDHPMLAGLCDEMVGHVLGVHPATRVNCRRWVQRRKHSGLTVWEADRCAAAINTHPTLVWGTDWFKAREHHDMERDAFSRLRCWVDAEEFVGA